MERKDFIEKDPLTKKVVTFLSNHVKESYTIQEITENLFDNVTTKQVQLVISLLVREGRVKATVKFDKPAYQIK